MLLLSLTTSILTTCIENIPTNMEGVGYIGCTNRSASGAVCLPWSENREDGVIKGESYCRNPGGRRRMWCRIEENPGWEYCDPIVTCEQSEGACPMEQCRWPYCDNDGLCDQFIVADGTLCDDKNSSTIHDICMEGVCSGVDPCEGKSCLAKNWCHFEGTCVDGYCTERRKPDGTICTTGAGMDNEHCESGMCVGSVTCNEETFNSTDCTYYVEEECIDDIPSSANHTDVCTDNNPQTTDRCSGGICVSMCNGRNNGCEKTLGVNDGNCDDDTCAEGLICGAKGSCARLYSGFKSNLWPRNNEYSWDREDRCCVPDNHCGEETCEGNCGNNQPFSGCTCSCNVNCKDQFNCCPDYEQKCYAHRFDTSCSCKEKCAEHSVQPCGCSCNPRTCVKEGNCCSDATELCDAIGFELYPTSNCTCGECGSGNDCGCICDIRCNRCQFHDLSRNSDVCDRCCDVEDKCSFVLPDVDVSGCTCQGKDTKCVASGFAACGTCACDDLCLIFDDCCPDKFFNCQGDPDIRKCTCKDQCGNDLAECRGCSCHSSCEGDSTCCPDYTDFCNEKHVIIPLTPTEKKNRRRAIIARGNSDNSAAYLTSIAAIAFFLYFHRRNIQRRLFGKSNK